MNYNSYIGLPYKENGRDTTGIDCWGLARLFYKNELGIELPSYIELYSGSNDPRLPQTINYYKDNWTKVESPKSGDLCLFNILGEPSHVGVYIGEGKFLHSRDGKDSVIDRLDSPQWFRRLEGFYRYTEKFSLLPITGMPNPLEWNSFVEFAQPGANAQGFADYLTAKYKLSEGFKKRLILMVDGVPVPQDHWNNTYFTENSVVNYKVVAQGRSAAGRMLAFFAVVAVAAILGPEIAPYIAEATGSAFVAGTEGFIYTFGTAQGWATATTLAIQFAGMALINAAFPIRPPKDPGQGLPTNMFSGQQNQANPFGAIPVVLGRNRVTGLLGAAPYIETLERTSKLHLLIIWGFGPLQVDRSTLSIGSTPISQVIDEQINPSEVAYTLEGSNTETTAETKQFNSYYPTDLQQQPSSPVELVNDSSGNPWKWITFTQPATSIKVALSFPDGLRKINRKTGDTAGVDVDIQIAIFKSQYGTASTLTTTSSPPSENKPAFVIPAITTIDLGSIDKEWIAEDGSGYNLYRKTILAIQPNGSVKAFYGGISHQIGVDAIDALALHYYKGSYTWITEGSGDGEYQVQVPVDRTGFKWEPTVPTNCFKLLSVIQNGSGIITTGIGQPVDLVSSNGSHFSVSAPGAPTPWYIISGTTVTVPKATITSNISPYEVNRVIFSSAAGVYSGVSTFVGNVIKVTSNQWTNQFLKEHAVWQDNGSSGVSTLDTITLERSGVVFPYTGYYTVDFSADNWGTFYLNNEEKIKSSGTWDTNLDAISSPSNSIRTQLYVTEGTYTVKVVGNNRQQDDELGLSPTNSNRGIALKISWIWDQEFNVNPYADNQGLKLRDVNEKDGINKIVEFKDLERATYTVGVRRLTSSVSDDGDWTRVWRSYLHLVTAYDSETNPPIKLLPTRTWNNYYTSTSYNAITDHRRLARTAIVVQSTNKVNGTIEGINAMVTTKALTWNTSTQSWGTELIATNNPASLFRYVLQHTANTFPVSDIELDLPTLGSWYEFCDSTDAVTGRPKLAYNSIISSTQSLMEVLKDICAAGMASPTFVNGKWSVVIDRARPNIIQHFTPQNSWGFESTKLLVKIPHAFRISYADEANAYQINEELVYDWGYDKDTTSGKKLADRFESIQFPGVTNVDQVRFFAKWHLAQLHKRPERYTINVDFEYLVCSRGDRVKVTHDLPLWGTGSARIKSRHVVGSDNILVLTESIVFDISKTYKMLVRKNPTSTGITTVPSVTLDIQPVTWNGAGYTAASASDYYNAVKVTGGSLNGVEVDNLVMVGELSGGTDKTTNDLVVLSIEPSSNLTAKLTLADYAEDIYTTNIDSLNTEFSSNITFINLEIVKNTINDWPVIIGINSSSVRSEQVSTGNYVNTTIITFANPPSKIKNASRIQLDIILATQLFNPTATSNTYYVEKDSSTLTVNGLKTGGIYKIRARYINSTGTVFGPWSPEGIFNVIGKTIHEYNATQLQITLEGTNLVVRALTADGTIIPPDQKNFEFRLYRNEGTGDFWNDVPNFTTADKTNNYLMLKSTGTAIFDLTKIPLPRISTTLPGIKYRIACRAIDGTNNYSATSLLASVSLATIQTPTLTERV